MAPSATQHLRRGVSRVAHTLVPSPVGAAALIATEALLFVVPVPAPVHLFATALVHVLVVGLEWATRSR